MALIRLYWRRLRGRCIICGQPALRGSVACAECHVVTAYAEIMEGERHDEQEGSGDGG